MEIATIEQVDWPLQCVVQCGAVRGSADQCSVLYCVAVRCSVLYGVAVRCSVREAKRNVLESNKWMGRCSALRSVLQCSAVQCSAARCSAVQCSAVCCSVLQCERSKEKSPRIYRVYGALQCVLQCVAVRVAVRYSAV